MKPGKQQPIGIFDSGIGGLTVANAISGALPQEQIIYFGDTAHLPYGDKSARAIKQYAYIIVDFLIEQQCKAVVIACNSASSVAYPFLYELYREDILIFNVIDPVVKGIAQDLSLKKVGIIGTQATIQSGIYERKLLELRPDLEIKSLATPLLAPMIEAGFYNNNISRAVLESYLQRPEFLELDALVLACTHYPLIRSDIASLLPESVKIFANTDFVPRELKLELERHYLLNPQRTGENRFYVSDYTEAFEQTTRAFYGQSIHLEHCNLWKNQ